jgi:hypothetical protein
MWVYVEDSRRTAGTFDTPMSVAKGVLNMLPHDICEGQNSVRTALNLPASFVRLRWKRKTKSCFDFQCASLSKNRGPVYYGAEFADVSRPMIPSEQVDIGVGWCHRVQPEPIRGSFCKVFCKCTYIADTITQWRKQYGKHGDAIPQILTERTFLNHVRQIAMRCCYHPHIDMKRIPSA